MRSGRGPFLTTEDAEFADLDNVATGGATFLYDDQVMLIPLPR
jgi:hypothetical protein